MTLVLGIHDYSPSGHYYSPPSRDYSPRVVMTLVLG